MDHSLRFIVSPGARVRLKDFDPSYMGPHKSHHDAKPEMKKFVSRMGDLQYLLYADGNQSLLIVLQGLDAAGKDGVIRHVFSGMNPQGTDVACFKQPSAEEASHDFLWRAHKAAPGKGAVMIFNRSHYEDVLVVRVHDLVPAARLAARYDLINQFEEMLVQGGTTILKFYLHISPEEQLERFHQRLKDPQRQWKISEGDYLERKFWPQYIAAYEDVLAKTSTAKAPWYVIPSNHKWFRNHAIARIITKALDDMKLVCPPVRVDLADIRLKYHAAREKRVNDQGSPGS